MSFTSQFKALFKKNIIFWRRNLCCSLCELLFPIILLFLIVLVRRLVKDTAIEARSYLEEDKFAYYYDDSVRTTIPSSTVPKSMNIDLYQGNPFALCIYFNRPLIAFVGSNELYPTLKTSLFSATGSNFSHSQFK